MDIKLTKFMKTLFILFVISAISWFLVFITPSDNIPFIVGSFSSIIGAFLIFWFLNEFRTMSKDDIEIMAKNKQGKSKNCQQQKN